MKITKLCFALVAVTAVSTMAALVSVVTVVRINFLQPATRRKCWTIVIHNVYLFVFAVWLFHDDKRCIFQLGLDVSRGLVTRGCRAAVSPLCTLRSHALSMRICYCMLAQTIVHFKRLHVHD